MAVDPATIKLAAKAAVSILTDEEERRKVLIICLAPVLGLVLLVSVILYIVTMPFAWLTIFLPATNITTRRISA